MNIDIKIENLKAIKKIISCVDNIQSDSYKKFIKQKVKDTLEDVMNRKLGSTYTTNEEAISLYRQSNHFKDTKKGFIVYNDAIVDVPEHLKQNYPNGKFSIALAFEYGVGIVGEGSYNEQYYTPWEYNKNHYNFQWYYTDSNGVSQSTNGYMGFEIYRNLVIEVNNNINKWTKEFLLESG